MTCTACGEEWDGTAHVCTASKLYMKPVRDNIGDYIARHTTSGLLLPDPPKATCECGRDAARFIWSPQTGIEIYPCTACGRVFCKQGQKET